MTCMRYTGTLRFMEGSIKMIYYTKKESHDHGLLVFKVIGAASQRDAEKITEAKWRESLKSGRPLEGPPTICPLFSKTEGYNKTL